MSSIVYALINPAMPGIVKIGKTDRDNPKVRMKELYTTGVPLPFECPIAVEVEDEQAVRLEKALHRAFSPYRINPSREFFEIEIYQVEAFLNVCGGTNVTPQIGEEATEVDVRDREAARQFKNRRPNLNFDEMGIPIGSELIFTGTGEEAIVTGDKMVRFRDEDMSLTKATRIAKEVDYSLPPTHYWTFEDRILSEIYQETYGMS